MRLQVQQGESCKQEAGQAKATPSFVTELSPGPAPAVLHCFPHCCPPWLPGCLSSLIADKPPSLKQVLLTTSTSNASSPKPLPNLIHPHPAPAKLCPPPWPHHNADGNHDRLHHRRALAYTRKPRLHHIVHSPSGDATALSWPCAKAFSDHTTYHPNRHPRPSPPNEFKMPTAGLKTIIALSFVLAVGFLLVILSCALWKVYYPLLVVATYVLAPLPNWICGRCSNPDDFVESSGNAVLDLGRFCTGFLVVMGVGKSCCVPAGLPLL